ncbi:hypothetical protein RK21_02023 [Pseudomonas plecoglossicida]|nr:hypothetical protein RK21_02023 [Pseudomonas plecoglossicida]
MRLLKRALKCTALSFHRFALKLKCGSLMRQGFVSLLKQAFKHLAHQLREFIT